MRALHDAVRLYTCNKVVSYVIKLYPKFRKVVSQFALSARPLNVSKGEFTASSHSEVASSKPVTHPNILLVFNRVTVVDAAW